MKNLKYIKTFEDKTLDNEKLDMEKDLWDEYDHITKMIASLEKKEDKYGKKEELLKRYKERKEEIEGFLKKLNKKFEDVYYEPVPQKINHREVIDKIVEKWLEEYIGLDVAFYYVKGNGDDIEVGSKTKTKNPSTGEIEIRKRPEDPKSIKHMIEEWEETYNDLVDVLKEHGYVGWELDLLGWGGFRMSCDFKKQGYVK